MCLQEFVEIVKLVNFCTVRHLGEKNYKLFLLDVFWRCQKFKIPIQNALENPQ